LHLSSALLKLQGDCGRVWRQVAAPHCPKMLSQLWA